MKKTILSILLLLTSCSRIEVEKPKPSEPTGKTTVYFFVGANCHPCYNEITKMNEDLKTYQKHIDGKLLVVVYVSGNKSGGAYVTDADVKMVKEGWKLDLEVKADNKRKVFSSYFGDDYSVPRSVIVDRNGNVLKLFNKGVSLNELDGYIS